MEAMSHQKKYQVLPGKTALDLLKDFEDRMQGFHEGKLSHKQAELEVAAVGGRARLIEAHCRIVETTALQDK